MTSEQFKALRIKRKLSQQQIGELLGFSKKWARMRISEIERGVRPLSQRTQALVGLLFKRRIQ